MATPLYQQAKLAFDKGGLPGVFLEVLGWDSRPNDKETFLVDNVQYVGTKVASVLNGIVVFEFDFQQAGIVTPSQQKEISKAVGKKYAERLVVFKTKAKSTWLWPKKTSGGALTFEKLEAPSDSLPTFLAQRLVALTISNEEFDKGVTLPLIREKLRGSFDTSTVTKKFYERFRNQHQELAKAISGLDAEQTHSYATLLLNRLMFIYFLQKKEFLNGDTDYLRNSLRKVLELQGQGKFFSFYKDLLVNLFHEGLNKKNGTFRPEEIASILGKVPYINGGIFGESDLENANDISVPDEVFMDIFEFFDSFTWHLDTRPTGKSDEINPEVIGYIFEQYINFTAGGKKDNGAYYTKSDVTGYMVSQTLTLRLLDCLVDIGLSPFQLLIGSGTRFINPTLLKGWDSETSSWSYAPAKLQAIYEADPISWNLLDESPNDQDLCLPEETWVETFSRREAVNRLISQNDSGKITEASGLISSNLNGLLLLLDAIEKMDDPKDLESLWIHISDLSVIDPTCGSGAFLFTALEVLELVYATILDRAEELQENSDFATNLIHEVSQHPNRRYFIRKHAALSNLYGTDLMEDAIETAKLRVFLALASCLDDSKDIEPLPDLDFNLKVGNLVVGLRDLQDTNRISDGDMFATKKLDAIDPKISSYMEKYLEFIRYSKSSEGVSSDLKLQIASLSKEIKEDCNRVLADLLGLSAEAYTNWVIENKPFHWFAEFPTVFSKGGFDVVIGNPPYIRQNSGDRKELVSIGAGGYETLNTPDFYAMCFERTMSLLAENGRLALIVPINLSFSDDFTKLRKLIDSKFDGHWWSTYDQLPQGLFEGAAVRNTIYIGGKFNEPAHYSTHHQVFTAATRKWLFDSLTFTKTTLDSNFNPIRGGALNGFFTKVRDSKGDLGPLRPSEVHVKTTANYWIPVFPKRPPILDLSFSPTGLLDPKVKMVELGEMENASEVVALLSGKIGFLWWQSIGDGFDVIPSTLVHLRKFGVGVDLASNSGDLKKQAEEVNEAGLNNTVVNMYRGTNYVSIRWSGIRQTSDNFDRLFLELKGLKEVWRPLNVMYRQVMRSNESRQMGQDTLRNREFWNLTQ
jgi:type I restriction-modification system DNA methylase subunit